MTACPFGCGHQVDRHAAVHVCDGDCNNDYDGVSCFAEDCKCHQRKEAWDKALDAAARQGGLPL